MLAFMFPVFVQDIHPFDAWNLEDAVVFVFRIVGPDIYMVVGKGERLYDPVSHLAGIRGSIVSQDDLLLLVHCVPYGLDAACVELGAFEFVDAREIIDGCEFLVEGCFQGVGAVKAFDEVAQDLGLLVGEINQLAEVLEG